MDNNEELRRLLREAEERAEEAERAQLRERQRANAAEQRAERAQERAERAQERADRVQERADRVQEQLQPTTLGEYIAACHTLVFSRFAIETRPELTSKGSITNPRGKWCPQRLRPWSDFLETQRIVFSIIYDTFPAEHRVFENRNFLTGLGNRVSQRPIQDKRTLEGFLHLSVEDPVRRIVDQLKQVQDLRMAFEMGDGVVFENHPHALSEVSDEVVERGTQATTSTLATSTPPRTPNYRRDLKSLRPDQICVYRSDSTALSRRTMIYISEYKPPHKLTAPHLRVGLRDMDIYNEVVNRETIPTTTYPEAHFQYYAERLTASAITQTYHYMIESGLEYGLLTTGEAIVFLKVDWDDPKTLYYHLAEPTHEVSAQPTHFHICTAVGQYLAFTLLALSRPGEGRVHGQEARDRAREGLNTWNEDFATTLHDTPTTARSAPDSSPGYVPTTYHDTDRSPVVPQNKTRQYYRNNTQARLTRPRDEEPSDDESMSRPPDTPTPVGRGARQTTRRSEPVAKRSRGGESKNQSQRQYCTQKCLLGMINGWLMDPNCPNLSSHEGHATLGPGQHPVSHDQFIDLLTKQLQHSLDDGITPLWVGGARGVLFQVTLLAYGYTFVGKGTVRAFIPDLEHESAVYARLKPVQGMFVPVFLGVVDLRTMNKTYYYDHRVYIVHMTFLSWGGCSMRPTGNDGINVSRDVAMQSLRALHNEGVVHRDVRLANMLFNSETDTVMMIDFERSTLLEAPRLTPVHPNATKLRRRKARVKLNRPLRWPERDTATAKKASNARTDKRFAEDMLMLAALFVD